MPIRYKVTPTYPSIGKGSTTYSDNVSDAIDDAAFILALNIQKPGMSILIEIVEED